ncbi:ScpA family protein [Acidithiobacillus sp. AMEEHan]|uniref:segregation and condensation protein A n=1 Tax=Acidithiobacillus sp. AMEEHan TaxID=2994951 RepID=UPI0027E48954|nr:ScpA family protein [Acidithiobacillus sp. AMEEHan]
MLAERAFTAGDALAIPEGLYIPPDALEVILDQFSGPLDLLLWLIRRNRMDIRDIPVAEVTRQYLAYLEEARRRQLELAADYLLMAAWLAEIKARMLLPLPPAEEGEAEDPRAELAERLAKLAQVQAEAEALARLPRAGLDFLLPAPLAHDPMPLVPPALSVSRLPELLQQIAQRHRRRQVRAPRPRVAVDLRQRILEILQRCRSAQHPLSFRETLPPQRDRLQLGLSLLAILELLRQQALRLLWRDGAWMLAAIEAEKND